MVESLTRRVVKLHFLIGNTISRARRFKYKANPSNQKGIRIGLGIVVVNGGLGSWIGLGRHSVVNDGDVYTFLLKDGSVLQNPIDLIATARTGPNVFLEAASSIRNLQC
nr:hypothetical protein Ahy_Scaffold5g107786 [Ipomoea trifida]